MREPTLELREHETKFLDAPSAKDITNVQELFYRRYNALVCKNFAVKYDDLVHRTVSLL
jgi:hypothetical protein